MFMQESGKVARDIKEIYILDASAFGNSALADLSELGYRHLYGIDLNQEVYNMPYYTRIKYSYGDMLNTHFPDNMLDFVYNVKGIRKASDLKRFIGESKRILDNNGYLLLTARSKKEAEEIINKVVAQKVKLFYTTEAKNLIGLCFKVTKSSSTKRVRELNIIAESLNQKEGVDTYVQSLKKILEKEGITTNLYKRYEEADRSKDTIIEYVPAFGLDFPKGNYLIDVHQTVSKSRFWIEMKEIAKKIISNPRELVGIVRLILSNLTYTMLIFKRAGKSDNETEILQKHKLIVRSREIAESSKLKNYVIMPLAEYGKPMKRKEAPKELHLGAMGFARRSKNFDKICELAKRLGIKATLSISISKADEATEKATSYIANDLYKRYNSNKIKILVGFQSDEKMKEIFAKCSHFISAANDGMFQSGSIRYMMKFGRPVISTDNYQAREAQSYRVKKLEEITVGYLRKTTEPVNLDDGFRYLIKILHYDYPAEQFKEEKIKNLVNLLMEKCIIK